MSRISSKVIFIFFLLTTSVFAARIGGGGGSLGGGSSVNTGDFIQNTLTPVTTTQVFSVSTGVVKQLIVSTSAVFQNMTSTVFQGVSTMTFDNGTRLNLSTGAVMTASGTVNISTLNIRGGGILRLTNTANTRQISMRALPGLSNSTTYTFNSDGSAGQLHTTNGSGNLTWSYGYPGTWVNLGTTKLLEQKDTTIQGPGGGSWDASTLCLEPTTIGSGNGRISVSCTIGTNDGNIPVYATILRDGTDISQNGNGFVSCYDTKGGEKECDGTFIANDVDLGHGGNYCVAIGNTDGSTTVILNRNNFYTKECSISIDQMMQ